MALLHLELWLIYVFTPMLSIGASTLPPSNFTSGGVPISMQDSCVTDHNMTATFFATSGLKSAHQATDGRMSFNRGN